VPRLYEMGVVGVYGPGTITDEIIKDIRRSVYGSDDSGAAEGA